LELKGKQTMNSQTQRRVINDPGGEVVAFKRHWRKPLHALIADALAHNRALLARLTPGIWAPPIIEDYERNGEIYRGLLRHTREQIAALETFATVDWRE
jgi:hypothetical protein